MKLITKYGKPFSCICGNDNFRQSEPDKYSYYFLRKDEIEGRIIEQD